MTRQPGKPSGKGGDKLYSEAGQARLAEALRENLRRRKAQARARTDTPDDKADDKADGKPVDKSDAQ